MLWLFAALAVAVTLTMLSLVIFTPLIMTKKDNSIGSEPYGEGDS
ncbi:MAG: hypothetical protein UIL37_05575 [Clostridia bacterium]|nr:hypothetical protein [Clostridia bacterium]